MEFVERSYWEGQKQKFEIASLGDQVRRFLAEWVKPTSNKSVLEIGCVPGRYLAYLGTQGYQLNGIDVLPEAIHSMKQWLKESGYKIGKIENIEWEKFPIDEKFDLVCSFGFIEHFEDYQEVLNKHFNLVAPGGTLIVTVPNYIGWLQNALHQFVDEENLKRHNMKSMQPNQWAQWASSSGFEVLYQGYFGYFTFWVEEADKRSAIKKWLTGAIIKSLPLTSRLLPNNRKGISPFCGLVARRK